MMTMLVDLIDKAANRQECVDRYYVLHGKCCAGCDWWRHINSVAGTCERHAPAIEGFPVTARGDLCGDFKDDFDWNSLPDTYRRRIGIVTSGGE